MSLDDELPMKARATHLIHPRGDMAGSHVISMNGVRHNLLVSLDDLSTASLSSESRSLYQDVLECLACRYLASHGDQWTHPGVKGVREKATFLQTQDAHEATIEEVAQCTRKSPLRAYVVGENHVLFWEWIASLCSDALTHLGLRSFPESEFLPQPSPTKKASARDISPKAWADVIVPLQFKRHENDPLAHGVSEPASR